MRTYVSPSDSHLRELSALLTKGAVAAETLIVDRNLPESDQHVLLSVGTGWEILFDLKSGQARCYRDDQPAHLCNLFQFVEKCREFCLSY